MALEARSDTGISREPAGMWSQNLTLRSVSNLADLMSVLHASLVISGQPDRLSERMTGQRLANRRTVLSVMFLHPERSKVLRDLRRLFDVFGKASSVMVWTPASRTV